ncbi:hypothetical protein KIN20_030443 [Parelaphostrongylus tenuis]|uniref:ShKT domain-containing protein n=1 Tax=Parelaphostrongylus tenuis TaxID=148309 RepID=A0AAD5R3R9_PARTN|nr:hypothetical protein KIN20_030443 [Parelaphostrongylus tenuis]
MSTSTPLASITIEAKKGETTTIPSAATTSGAKKSGTTTAGCACEDHPTAKCTKLMNHCDDSHYYDLLNKYCCRTCGR